MSDRRPKDEKKESRGAKKPHARTLVIHPEERAKRGRWITILLFLLTLFFGYAFWQK